MVDARVNILRDIEVTKVSNVLQGMGWEIVGIEIDEKRVKIVIQRSLEDIIKK